jgi:hypothetical protein
MGLLGLALHLDPDVLMVSGRIEVRDHLEPTPLGPVVHPREEVEEVERQVGLVTQEASDLPIPPGGHGDHGVPVDVLGRPDVVPELGPETVGDLRR